MVLAPSSARTRRWPVNCWERLACDSSLGDSLPWCDALPSAQQIRRLDSNEASKHFRREQQEKFGGRDASGGEEGGAAAAGVRDVRVRDGRAVWARGHGDDERAGADAALSSVPAAVLVHSGVAGSGGADHGDSRGGRILPLGAGGVRRLLGIPGRVVELELVVFAGRGVRRFVHGLPDVLLPGDCGLEALRGFAGVGGVDRLRKRAGHSGR